MTAQTTTRQLGQHHQGKRLVLFAGPHKSASSSVQEFFMRYASDKKTTSKHPSLVNWTWPYNPRRRSYMPRKGFAPLVVEYENEELRNILYDTLMKVWNTTTTSNSNGGLIFGSEEYDRFGDTPWSHRNGFRSIQDILQLTKPDQFEIVVNYRVPRHQQWISIWKQLTRTHPIPYREYLCQDDVRTWEYLDAVANPLGLVQAFRSKNWKTTLIDMSGVAYDKMDVAHVVACEVLQVPCKNGWLPGLEQILQNTKTGDPEMSNEQLDQMEWILRQRDCSYRETLESDDGLNILHRHSLWENCPSTSSSSPIDSSRKFQNTTFLLGVLRDQIGCGDGTVNISNWMNQETISFLQRHPRDPTSPDHMIKAAMWQQRILFLLVVAMIAWLYRRRLKARVKHRNL